MSNLGQHDGDGIRYAMHLSAPKGGSAQMLRDPAGGWVSYEDYARLKAEVERLRFAEDLLKDENQHLHKEQPLPDGWNSAVAKACDLLAEKEKENARLKAEVERLRKGDERDMTTAYLYAAEQSKDTIARLKAEVERLTEAGDEMAVCFNCPTCAKNWNAAKGVQS